MQGFLYTISLVKSRTQRHKDAEFSVRRDGLLNNSVSGVEKFA